MSGFFRAYSEKVRQASGELPERELRVYMALLSFADCRGWSWPGYRALVLITGLCNDAVRDALQALEALEYLQVVRKGTRDALTGAQLANVWFVEGAFVDDEDCVDVEEPSLESSSNEDSYHHHRTPPVNTTIQHNHSTQPKTPPPPDSFEVEEEKPKAKRNAKTKTPERSSIPNSPSPRSAGPSPRNFYRGPLSEFAQPLEDGEDVAIAIYDQLQHKMTLRTARYLTKTYGRDRVNWALGHLSKQTDVNNPAGYIRALLERHAVESVDGQPVDPGLAYITGAYADYIDH